MRKLLVFIFSVGLVWPWDLHAAQVTRKAEVGLAGWVIFSDPGNVSLRDFALHAAQVDRAYFDCYHVGPDGLPAPNPQATAQLKAYAVAAAQKGQCQPWVMCSNWTGGFNSPFDNKRVRAFLNNDSLQGQHIQTLIAFAKQDQAAGIQVNYQDLEPEDKGKFFHFVQDLSGVCKKNGLLLVLSVFGKYQQLGFTPTPLSLDYQRLGNEVDEMVNMPGQQRGPYDSPGYLEDLNYLEQVVPCMEANVSNVKVEVGVPVIGYSWDTVAEQGQAITSSQCQALRQSTSARAYRDTQNSQELTFSYLPHNEVWFADAASAWNAANLAKRFKSYGISIWYFGGEGADFWGMMAKQDSDSAPVDPPPSTEPPLARNPQGIPIFTDKVRGHYYFASDNNPNDLEKANESTITLGSAQGKHWLDIRLSGITPSEAGMTLNSVEDFTPFLQNGALQFYIRGIKGGEKINVGFFTAPREQQKWSEMAGGPTALTDYTALTTQWQLVTIPILDFPQKAKVTEAAIGETVQDAFRWKLVQTLFFSPQIGGDEWVEFQVANIRVVPSYDPKSVHKK